VADDSVNSAVTHGVAVLTGGGLTSALVRFLLGSVTKRLDSIEEKLDGLGDKADARHEKIIVDVADVKRDAQAAHRRVDDLANDIVALRQELGAMRRRK
jgi:hypothetical protein